MKNIALFFILAVLLNMPLQAAESYTIDSRHTFPGFEINHLGFSVQRGRFNRTRGKLTMDPEAGTGSLKIVVEADSISTGLDELEKHLRSEDFFDVARYPKIYFSSEKLKFKQQKLVAVEGRLTMHGKTKPVTLTVDHFYCGRHMKTLKYVCGANAYTMLKRSDFGVDKYAPMLADEVKIVIQVEAIKN